MAENDIDQLFNRTANGETILTINEDERIIEINGDLLLGVENDYKANKIFFLSPKIVGNDIDLSLLTVEIFVSFKNASNELYISTCTKETYSDENFVLFSWLLTKEVTKTNGKVNFIVCAKNVVDSTLRNEWHTSIATGIVLKGITENDRSLIIDTDPTSSIHQLKEEVIKLQDKVGDVNGYSKTEINELLAALTSDDIRYINAANQENEYLTETLDDIYSKITYNSEEITKNNTNLTTKIEEINTNLTTNLETKINKPDSEGIDGQILMSKGTDSKPIWVDQRYINANAIRSFSIEESSGRTSMILYKIGGQVENHPVKYYLTPIRSFYDSISSGSLNIGTKLTGMGMIRGSTRIYNELTIIVYLTNIDTTLSHINFYGYLIENLNREQNYLYAEITITNYKNINLKTKVSINTTSNGGDMYINNSDPVSLGTNVLDILNDSEENLDISWTLKGSDSNKRAYILFEAI